MSLIDGKLAEQLQRELVPLKETAGGSSANSLANIALLGGKTQFFGVTSNDMPGKNFNESLRKIGVEVANHENTHEEGSGQSYVLVTPDGERTMLTHLGSSDNITERDLDLDSLKQTKIFFVQTYVINEMETLTMLKNAFATVHDYQGVNALALSSAFMVKKNKQAIKQLLPKTDILIGNKDEFATLFGSSSTKNLIALAQKQNFISVITLGKAGAVVVLKKNIIWVQPPKIEKLVDTIGAGDAFAGGFLYAYTQGYALEKCAQHGSFMAGLVLSQIGGRPAGDDNDKLSIARFRQMVNS